MRLYLAAHHHITNFLARAYPGRIGACIQPKHWGAFKERIPYFLDNNQFSDWRQGKEFSGEKFKELMKKCAQYSTETNHWPDFVVCPDVFGKPLETRERYFQWESAIKRHGFRIAFVIQPGCELEDVPESAEILFTGGGEPFKYEAIRKFLCIRKPIHVGGLAAKKLNFCHFAGASSGDSSGYFRGDQRQLQRLYDYLADSSGILNPFYAEPRISAEFKQLSFL